MKELVNGAGLTSGSIARSGASGGGSAVGWRLVSTTSWRRLGCFRKVTDGGLVRKKAHNTRCIIFG